MPGEDYEAAVAYLQRHGPQWTAEGRCPTCMFHPGGHRDTCPWTTLPQAEAAQ